MAKWLMSCGITTVAMESTGVYWIPLYDVLEQNGVKPCLVDARGMKNVPGRRTDWHECQWLQFLHSVGLLRAAFRPDGDVCAVRSVMRHRSEQVLMANQHIQHMHKALTQMNVQVHHVISDLNGVNRAGDYRRHYRGRAEPGSRWPNCGICTSKPARKPFANRWWATGVRSICLRSSNRARVTNITRSRLLPAMRRSRSWWWRW